MARLSVQDEFQSGDNVTATNLNNLVNQANFVAGASNTTDDSTLEVHTSGYLKVKNNGVGDEHLQQMTDAEVTTAGNEDGRAVTTNHIRNDAVTYDKMQNVAANSVIGNPTGSTATPQAITIADLSTDVVAAISGATAHTSDTDSDGINDTGGADGLLSADDKTDLDRINSTFSIDGSGKVGLGIAAGSSGYKLEVLGSTTSGSNSSIANLHASAAGGEAVLLVKNDSTTGEGTRLALFNSNTSSYPDANKVALILESDTPGLCVCFNTDAGASKATFKFLSDSNAFFIENTTSTPATPTGGGVLYVDSGDLKYKGPSGLIRTFGGAISRASGGSSTTYTTLTGNADTLLGSLSLTSIGATDADQVIWFNVSAGIGTSTLPNTTDGWQFFSPSGSTSWYLINNYKSNGLIWDSYSVTSNADARAGKEYLDNTYYYIYGTDLALKFNRKNDDELEVYLKKTGTYSTRYWTWSLTGEIK